MAYLQVRVVDEKAGQDGNRLSIDPLACWADRKSESGSHNEFLGGLTKPKLTVPQGAARPVVQSSSVRENRGEGKDQ